MFNSAAMDVCVAVTVALYAALAVARRELEPMKLQLPDRVTVAAMAVPAAVDGTGATVVVTGAIVVGAAVVPASTALLQTLLWIAELQLDSVLLAFVADPLVNVHTWYWQAICRFVPDTFIAVANCAECKALPNAWHTVLVEFCDETPSRQVT